MEKFDHVRGLHSLQKLNQYSTIEVFDLNRTDGGRPITKQILHHSFGGTNQIIQGNFERVRILYLWVRILFNEIDRVQILNHRL